MHVLWVCIKHVREGAGWEWEGERQGSEGMWDIKYGGGLSRVQEVDVLATGESNKCDCVKDKREGGERERGAEGLDRRKGRGKGGSAFQAYYLEPSPHDRSTCPSWQPAPTSPWTALFSLGYRTFTGAPATAP